ncbi:MAG: flagellar protein FlaG [Chloroflexi bacterium]|jgi:uncharacterized FlaG/YvyC family protein|nr:flagellar protein FlaG [Anaerolineaceae bacterium]NMB90649.1 flagellar protein FlaG [Chloroflexota bacterium]
MSSTELSKINLSDKQSLTSYSAGNVYSQDASTRADAAGAASEDAQQATAAKSTPAKGLAQNPDIRLKFMVDSDSNEITVLILDRASKQILRTIPPSELNNFKEGDLLTLFT